MTSLYREADSAVTRSSAFMAQSPARCGCIHDGDGDDEDSVLLDFKGNVGIKGSRVCLCHYRTLPAQHSIAITDLYIKMK